VNAKGFILRKILSIVCTLFVAHSANATIYQWYDHDADGSLWLSDSNPVPHVDLSGQLLWWAELSDATLRGANLSNTNLVFSTFGRASLSQVNFSNSWLYGVNFLEADLTYADFTGSNLEYANVQHANLFHVNLSDANLSNLRNWEDAFWLAARYNANTIFPEGMDPDAFAMFELEVPAPAVGFVFLMGTILKPRRRVRTH
jgi:hypothetical protein